jgi:hypothetical protein
MAKSFSELVKSRRDKGGSITGSISYGIKERLKEKFDPRRMINQKGLLTSLFPSLRAYQAGGSKTGQQLNSPSMMSESLTSLEPVLESISINTKLSAKNSMVLPMMHRDINVIRQNMVKLVKLEGGTPAGRADKFFMKSRDLQAAYDVQSKSEKSIKPTPKEDGDSSFLQILLGGILKGITTLGGIITSAFSSIATTIATIFKKIVNIKELAKAVLLKESFKTMLAAMLGAVLRPLLPILIAAAIAEYFRFNSITESLNKDQQATNARQIPGLGAPNEKGERKGEPGNVRNKELSTSTMVGKYNKDTVQGIVEGDYQVVEVFLPGTNQREYLPLLTDEAQDLKDNYHNLYVALNQLDKLSKEKGGASHEKIAQFVALRDESQKNIYTMWQKNLKGRFNQPPENLMQHIENKLKYPNLSHYEGKIKSMQDSMIKALTGIESENALTTSPKNSEPEGMVTVTSVSSPQIEPVIKDSGNTIDVGSKQIKSQVNPNNGKSPEVNVNNNNNSVSNKNQIQTIPSAYDPTISTKLVK